MFAPAMKKNPTYSLEILSERFACAVLQHEVFCNP